MAISTGVVTFHLIQSGGMPTATLQKQERRGKIMKKFLISIVVFGFLFVWSGKEISVLIR
jgi:hypothetical protein